jgi:hypothetical protein
MRGATLRALRPSMADDRSVVNARLRTSTTAAIFGTAPWERSARSTMVGSNPGGRLSTTNQPRSSRDLAAVLRPAPDIPVMTTMSGAVCSSAGACSRNSLTGVTGPPRWAGRIHGAGRR